MTGCHDTAKVGDKSLTAKEGGLSRTMKSSFSDLCIKYDDIRNVDRMAAVQASQIFILVETRFTPSRRRLGYRGKFLWLGLGVESGTTGIPVFGCKVIRWRYTKVRRV